MRRAVSLTQVLAHKNLSMKAMLRNLLAALTIIFLPFPLEAQEITGDTPQGPANLSEELDFPAARPGARSRLMPEIVIDKVIAVVDGEPLTASDLRRHIIAQDGTPPEDLRRLSPEV